MSPSVTHLLMVTSVTHLLMVTSVTHLLMVLQLLEAVVEFLSELCGAVMRVKMSSECCFSGDVM